MSKKVGPDVWIPCQVRGLRRALQPVIDMFADGPMEHHIVEPVLVDWARVFSSHKVRADTDEIVPLIHLVDNCIDACSVSLRAASSPTSCSTSHTTTQQQNVSVLSPQSHRTLTIDAVPIRLAWFWVSNYVSHVIGAFLATGLLRLRGVNGQAGWRYLFLIEGCLTLLIGLISFVMMPPGPTQTKAWYRPKGWFTERLVLRTFFEVVC